ncbi:MAG: hypothetical protein AABM29_02795 [Actinomycetota bacterium]
MKATRKTGRSALDAPSRWSSRPRRWDPTPEEFFAHPERWPYRYSDGTTGAYIRWDRWGADAADGRYQCGVRKVFSDDPDLDQLAARGWRPD